MHRENDESVQRPLPREWLPPATPQAGSDEWEALRGRVMVAVGSTVPSFTRGQSVQEAGWVATLGTWWRPAAAIAAAAALLVILIPAPPARPSGSGALALSLVAAGGEPAALLGGLGIPAEPVLALIALEGRAP